MSYIRKTFRVLGGMFKALRIVIIMLIIAGSLALNATLLAWSAGSLAVGTAIKTVTGFQSVSSALLTRNATLKASNTSLQTRNESLRTENMTLNANKKKVGKITGRMAKRTSRGAVRNLASVPLESTPFIGVATVVGVTAFELYDACNTMKDLKELNKLMDHKAPEGVGTVCGLKMPWQKKSSADSKIE